MFLRVKRPSISRDYIFYATVVMVFVVVVYGFSIYSSYSAAKEERLWQYRMDAVRLEESFSRSFLYVENFMRFTGEKISQSDAAPATIARILNNKTHAGESGHDYFTWTIFDFVTPDGKVVATSTQGVLKQSKIVSPLQRSWMTTAPRDPWEIYMSKPDNDIVSGEYIIPLGMGITSDHGEFLGIISMGFNIEKLTRKLEKNIAHGGISFVILDKDFEVVTQSFDQERKVYKEFFTDMLDSKNFMDSAYYFNTPVMFEQVNYSYVYMFKDFPYYVAIGENKYLQHLRFKQLILPKIINAVLIALFFLITLYLFRMRIIKPVLELSKAAHDIAYSSKNIHIPRVDTFELGTLARALIRMKLYKKREKRIATEKLSASNQKLKEKSGTLKKLNRELLKTKEQLEDAVQIARESKAAKDMFLKKLRNEFNLPLQTILRQADEILADKKNSDEVKKAAQSIRNLAYQLGTASSYVLTYALVDTSAIIKECVAIHKERAFMQKVKYTMNIKQKLPFINVDEIRFRQIVIGVIYHSLALVPEEEAIHIAAKVTSKKGKPDMLTLTISDTGFGISEKDRKKLIDEVGPTGISRNSDGTDITIADIHNLVSLHKGSFVINSSPNMGTEFVVNIPYLSDDEIDILSYSDSNQYANVTPLFGANNN